MIVDTSALVAILFGEPEAAEFASLIASSSVCRISVVNRLELTIVLGQQTKPDASRQADAFLRAAGIVEEPVTLLQGELARQAYYDFGRGRHPAKLNFGDCFAYALAKAMDEPLLYKGQDFVKTDIRPVRRSN
ncbi:MAG: type II toxin-antitoxin system VapC family toxin [Bryobacteraceae bacterium]